VAFLIPFREAFRYPKIGHGYYIPYHNTKERSKSFRTSRLERELQMVAPSATTCSCIAILRVSLVRFAAITLCVASRVFVVVVVVVVVYFVIESVRKLLDIPSHIKYNIGPTSANGQCPTHK
jgi:hypothetical protein